MKKLLAFLGGGTLWILLSSFIWIETPIPPVGVHPETLPFEAPLLERDSSAISQPSFFSHLETKWRSARLLQTAA